MPNGWKKRLYKLIVAALLAAMSIILSILKIDLTESIRISFAYLPIMLAGAILGPGWGAAVGALGDFLGWLVKPVGTYFPPIATTSMLAGAIPGLVFWALKRRSLPLKSILSAALVQVLGSLFLQAFWLHLLYGSPYPALLVARLPVALGMTPVFCALLYVLLRALYRAKIDQRLS